MAGVGGHFLSGLAGSIQGMPQRLYEMKWKKDKEKKLQAKQDELMERMSIYSKTAEELGADGWYSNDDMMKLNALTIAGGTEFQDMVQTTRKHIQGMYESQVERDMDLVDSFIEMAKDLNIKEIDEALEIVRGYVKSEGALNKLAAYDSLYKKKHELQPKAETFPTAAGVKEAYPGAGVKYTEEGYVPVIGEEAAPKALTYNEKRFNWKLEQVELGRMTLNQLLESEGVKMSPEEAKGLEKQVQDIRTEGQRAGLDPAKINKAIQDKILGKTDVTEPKPETVSTLKSWEKMFDMRGEDRPRNEEDYNRKLELLRQSEDKYTPTHATWKEALIWQTKDIFKDLEAETDRGDRATLLDIYRQKLKEIATKYPEVNLDQFPKPKELGTMEKFLNWLGI